RRRRAAGARRQRRLRFSARERGPDRLGSDAHESARSLRGGERAVNADPILFRDLAYVFLAAILAGSPAWLPRPPPKLGYVLGGLLISPVTPGPSVSDVHTFELFAEIGVVLLMFSLGIEFSLKDLMGVKWIALVGGPLGIVLSTVMGMTVGSLLGWSPVAGAVVGMVVSPASTMVLARLLVGRGGLPTRHGRIMSGVALVGALAGVGLF